MESKSGTRHKGKHSDKRRKRSRRHNSSHSDSESEASFRNLKSDSNIIRSRGREERKDDKIGRGLYDDREISSKYGVRGTSDRDREPCDTDDDHGGEIRNRHGDYERFGDRDRERIRDHSRDVDKERSHGRNREKNHIHKKERNQDRHDERSRNTRSPTSERKIRQDHRRKGLESNQEETSNVCHDSSDQHQDKYNADCATEFESDFDFDYTQYKHSLNKIFFRDQDYIKRGTPDYDDFWLFAARFQAFQKKKAQRQMGTGKMGDRGSVSSLGIPLVYDNRHRINLTLVTKHADDFIRHGRLIDADVEKEITVNRVKQFKNMLLCYIDFKQKEKLSKLMKIRKDQKTLPIYQYKEMIVKMVKENQVVVVAGDTGCGKSTQVPQYLLEGGFTKIACTQPRRIACISLSKRVGFETLNEYGTQVAYQVRFEKTKSRFTRILFLTEGLLLRQMSTDAELSQYSVIVIDEVHERHINTDFLLGVLKCLLRQRKDLKLVLMSATININLFSGYFDEAPVVKVPGRLYPIQLEYCPITRDELGGKNQRLDPSPYLKILQRIDHKYPSSERGDLLIFLSGMSEIMAVVDAARMYAQKTKRWIVLPLHSALSIAEQDKVFDIAPEGVRKCIVSTNIAETSVTIDGVRFIIDSGKVKEMSFDPKYKMQRLQEFWISRASAEQRKGRAGRTGPGVCFRLYGEADYNEFQEYSTPEIQRVPIDSLLLQLIAMGLPDSRRFPFLEAPAMSSIENSISILKEQGALTEDETLTPIGQMLSRLPVDVVIGKMLIMGSIFHMIDPVLSIAAAMSVQSPFTSSRGHIDHDAAASRKSLESEHGDPFTLLNAFDEWIQVKAEGRGTKKWCRRRALEEQRFYEMTKLKTQFKELLQDHGLLEKLAETQRYHSSEERRKQHGDRKRLGQLKKEQRKSSKRRKVLKLEDDDFTISGGEEEEDETDALKDLEFRLSHDLNKLQETSNRSRHFTRRDINLLKIILSSGLYPQVAIADDCNSFKSDSEQAFHTKSKPFVLLHPTSVFACQPDLLKPQIDVDSEKGQSGSSKLEAKMSTKHELLTFVSLLETNKPYLVNIMRVPALQTLLLFSNALDTNTECSRVVCDGWLEIRFKNDESIQEVLSSVVRLRQTWHNLLQLRLEDTFLNFEGEREINPKARKLERILAEKLTDFLSSKVSYTVRRVLAAEKERLYRGPGDTGVPDSSDLLKLAVDNTARPHPVKGGTQVNHYLTLGCLLDDVSASVWGEYTSHMQKHWTCPSCNTSMIVSVVERLQHEVECQTTFGGVTLEDTEKEAERERAKQMNPLKKSYFCPDCDKEYDFTTTEILKHKKSHLTSK
ncbi:probable ATP-dependent RNA helicase DHX34 [Liolophura sinensis]|uniref:probable ATP-dependent RNA helicase DHX34 n=1 Tax=Liolophura sinensis TaxID=3198878 RepID=UPI0031582C64